MVFECEYCKRVFESKNACNSHRGKCKQNPNAKPKVISEKWLEAMHKRKGNGTNQYTKARELGLPKPQISSETKRKLSEKCGHKQSDASKKKISDSLKKAHAEGRAHNIGECRWNNKPSYPEQWFMDMMKNEFGQEVGIDYQREFPFHRFSLDFAWPSKKLCVEIDGEQHQRFQEQKLRDAEKDKLLKDEGWIEIREEWKTIFNNPKDFIERIRAFSSEA